MYEVWDSAQLEGIMWKSKDCKKVHSCMRSQFNHVQLFVTLWTVALQAPLSMGFSRWEYWSTYSMPCPPSRDFPGHQESNWCLRCLLHWRQILCPLSHLGSPCKKVSNTKNGEGNGNWPQYPHLENSMDRGAWQLQSMGSQRVEYDLATKEQQQWPRGKKRRGKKKKGRKEEGRKERGKKGEMF